MNKYIDVIQLGGEEEWNVIRVVQQKESGRLFTLIGGDLIYNEYDVKNLTVNSLESILASLKQEQDEFSYGDGDFTLRAGCGAFFPYIYFHLPLYRFTVHKLEFNFSDRKLFKQLLEGLENAIIWAKEVSDDKENKS